MAVDTGFLKDLVRDVPDFPRPGVVFKDITPLLADAAAFAAAVSALAGRFAGAGAGVDAVVGIEARGFIAAAPVAVELSAGFVPVRKSGKLPFEVTAEDYQLEYGSDRLEVHSDGVRAGQGVLIVDDVLATGGTASAAVRLVERLGGRVVGLGFFLELGFLGGRDRLAGYDVVSLLDYE
ncbi:MAG: adenine phosphoribosyltransferase [Acidimicrobiales bacterium]